MKFLREDLIFSTHSEEVRWFFLLLLMYFVVQSMLLLIKPVFAYALSIKSHYICGDPKLEY